MVSFVVSGVGLSEVDVAATATLADLGRAALASPGWARREPPEALPAGLARAGLALAETGEPYPAAVSARLADARTVSSTSSPYRS
jgi:hypothetical protein